MNEIVNYVERAFSRIPDSKRKTEIVQDIIGSLEENAGKHIKGGKEYEDAVNKAIVDFGDINEIIDELREKTENIQYKGKSLLWFSIIGALVIIALVIFINWYYTRSEVWWVYPAFAVLWWPMCVFFFGGWRKKH